MPCSRSLFFPCSCGGKRPWRWRIVLILLFLVWKRRCQGWGYLQLCWAQSTLDRPLSTSLLFSWFSRQIRFKCSSALSSLSLKELITAQRLITSPVDCLFLLRLVKRQTCFVSYLTFRSAVKPDEWVLFQNNKKQKTNLFHPSNRIVS